MSGTIIRGAVAALLVGVAAGCAGRSQTLSPVHAIPRGAIPGEPAPDEHFYVLVFGSQRATHVPQYTHTWATVVRTSEAPGRPCEVADVHTISWMPADLDIHPWQFTPVCGRNLELHETIRMALDAREHVAMWGPYEMDPELYRRFLMQKAFLESGRVGYQCIDTLGAGADGTGCDCIHAITDMDPEFTRSYYRLAQFGEAGSRFIVRQLVERGAVFHPEVTHDWLIGRLGLCRYPIIRRPAVGRPNRQEPNGRGATGGPPDYAAAAPETVSR